MLSSETMKKVPPTAAAVVGAAVRQLRRDRGWTLATLSQLTDISVSGLSQLENGKTTRVRRDNLVRLASAFNVSESDLDPALFARHVAETAITLDQRRLVEAVLSLPVEDAAEAKQVLLELSRRRRKGEK